MDIRSERVLVSMHVLTKDRVLRDEDGATVLRAPIHAERQAERDLRLVAPMGPLNWVSIVSGEDHLVIHPISAMK